MSDDLEARLRRALRPVDPGEQLTQNVLERITGESEHSVRWLPTRRLRWASVAVAASVVLGVLLSQQWQARRTQEGLQARHQLLEALRVTSNQLDIAYRAVNDADNSVPITGPDGGT